MTPEKCDCCGRFIKLGPGVSWAQSWSYDMSGFPDLHDPGFRCATCTEKEGRRETNCAHPERYSGIITDAGRRALSEGDRHEAV